MFRLIKGVEVNIKMIVGMFILGPFGGVGGGCSDRGRKILSRIKIRPLFLSLQVDCPNEAHNHDSAEHL